MQKSGMLEGASYMISQVPKYSVSLHTSRCSTERVMQGRRRKFLLIAANVHARKGFRFSGSALLVLIKLEHSQPRRLAWCVGWLTDVSTLQYPLSC